MKVKIAIAAVLCALFVAVPSATSKGKPAGLSLGAFCDNNDACVLTGSGFAANTSYALDVTTSCGGLPVLTTSVNADSTGAINTTILNVGEGGCSGNSGWTFTLSTLGKRSSTVASATAADNATD